MSGCGCSFTPVENKETEEIKYTDALAEQFAAEVGVDPRPNETLVEIDERFHPSAKCIYPAIRR